MAASSSNDNLKKLTGAESFKFWKYQSTVLFKAQGSYEIVNGNSKYEDLTDDKEKKKWVRKGDLA